MDLAAPLTISSIGSPHTWQEALRFRLKDRCARAGIVAAKDRPLGQVQLSFSRLAIRRSSRALFVMFPIRIGSFTTVPAHRGNARVQLIVGVTGTQPRGVFKGVQGS